jgi:sugar lactone lactonase YvrE
MVEGLTVDSDGNVYTPTFNPNGSAPSQLFTFGPDGSLKTSVRIKGSSQAMLGLAFRPPGPPQTNELLIIDFGASQVLSVNPNNGNAKPCITLPSNSGPNGLNALTFDTTGAIYVSDSFQGIIWRFSPLESGSPCGVATAWVTDALLSPDNGVPGFGANGVEFNNKQDTMFVCNTAMDWIVQIPFSGGTGGGHGKPVVFTNSINGCDGIAIDSQDNIWAAANQADEMVVVDKTGKVIAKLGDFDGLSGGTTGTTKGLLFPASPAFSPHGDFLWVTNLELDLRSLGPNNSGPQTVDSQWAADITQHSIAKIPVPASFPFFSQ